MSSSLGHKKSTFKAAMAAAGSSSSTAKISSSLSTKILKFTQAEEAVGGGDVVKGVQLYSQFLLESPNEDGKLSEHQNIIPSYTISFLVEVAKFKETAILKAAQLIKNAKDSEALAAFVRSLSSIWNAFARAKTAKLSKTGQKRNFLMPFLFASS
jgi:hypothetical protein